MGNPSPNLFETFVLSEIERRLELRAGELSGRTEVLQAVRGILHAKDLSKEEQHAVRESPDEQTLSNAMLSLRLGRALEAGLALASRLLGKTAPVPPQVVALAEPWEKAATLEEGAAEIRNTLTLTGAAAGGSLDAATLLPMGEPHRETLLVAAASRRSEVEAATRALPEGVRPRGNVEFAALPGDLDQLRKQLLGLVDKKRSELTLGIEIGDTLRGKYRIDKKLGEGGFGAVFQATDLDLGTKVAIKVLHGTAARKDRRDAFKQEAVRLTRLGHPNIVDWKVFEEREDGSYYFVMEFLDGEELSDTLEREGALEPGRVARILHQVLSALRKAHQQSGGEPILHLDLKPQNVFVVDPGQETETVKVIDFGISLIAGRSGGLVADNPPATPVAGTLVSLGADESEKASRREQKPVLRCTSCTPEYASPEQAAHFAESLSRMGISLENGAIRPLDGRSDLYSLAVIGFQLLTGRLPFEISGKQRLEVLKRQADEPAPSVRSMGKRVPRALAAFIDRCLRKDRDQRFRDTNEAFEILDAIVNPPAWKAVLKVTVPLVIVAAVALVLVWLRQPGAEFSLVTRSDNGETVHSQDHPVFVGFRSPKRVVTPSDLPDGAISRRLQVVRDADRARLENWTAGWTDDEEIEVTGSAAYSGLVRLELLEGGKDRYSAPFKVEFLPDGTGNVVSIGVEGQNGRAIDPLNQTLLLGIQGQKEGHIAEVWIRDPEGKRERARFQEERNGVLMYGAALGGLKPKGPVELEIEVTDAIGSPPLSVQSRRLDFVDEAIKLSEPVVTSKDVRLERTGRGYVLYPRTDAVLVVETQHDADVILEVKGLGGEELSPPMSGTKEKTALLGATHTFKIPSLKEHLGEKKELLGVFDLLAKDDRYVVHRDKARGEILSNVPFVFRAEEPSLQSPVLVSSSGRHQLSEEAVTYSNGGSLSLELARSNATPMNLEVSMARDGGDAVIVKSKLPLAGPATLSEINEKLPVTEDGVYAITTSISVEGNREASPSFTVIVDTSPPTLRLDGLPPSTILKKESPNLREVLLVLEDEPLGTKRLLTPVNLSWDLVRRNAAGRSLPSPLSIATLPGETAVREVLLRLDTTPLEPEGAEGDGEYVLRVSGKDRSGNDAVAAETRFEVSFEGPQCEITVPSKGAKEWGRDSRKMFPLRVTGRDPNGTLRIEYVLISTEPSEDAPEPLRGDLNCVERGDPTQSRWEHDFPFTESWSGRDVELDLVAYDLHGTSRRVETLGIRLPEILPEYDQIIQPRFRSREEIPIGRMILVRGNWDGVYEFRGRTQKTEEDAFAKARVEDKFLSIDWNMDYPKGAIEDFYLDETEVTRGQYHGFLQAEDGFPNPLHWPGGVAPDAARRDDLLTETGGGDDLLPITSVTWAEAHAYAAWVGKILPSHVQWEYAVRGGLDYRVYAAQPTRRVPEQFNFRFPGETTPREAWKVDRGLDLSPDGIRNLDTNVAEWTASPVTFDGNGPRKEREDEHARRYFLEFADPSRTIEGDGGPADYRLSSRYYAVGGHFDGSLANYQRHTTFGRESKAASLGFRCAVRAGKLSEHREGRDVGLDPDLAFDPAP